MSFVIVVDNKPNSYTALLIVRDRVWLFHSLFIIRENWAWHTAEYNLR